jgi:SAM-dependent methyltransferase
VEKRYEGFPDGFFRRQDEQPDPVFYEPSRFVTHIDEGAIAAAGALYAELGVEGRVLDICSSWVSHLLSRPTHLTVLGMNAAELAANPMADERVVHDLNAEPSLPFADHCFDAAVCTVSVDYLVRPIEVLDEVARVLVPGGVFCCTFSNRVFPTKAVLGWLYATEEQRPLIVAAYFERSTGWAEPTVERRTPLDHVGDPLWGVWARTVDTVDE